MQRSCSVVILPLPGALRSELLLADTRVVGVGSIGAGDGGWGDGIPFHRHFSAWFALLHGSKRWHLFPPSVTPPNSSSHRSGTGQPAMGHAQWVAEVLPTLLLDESRQPLELLQVRPVVCHGPPIWGALVGCTELNHGAAPTEYRVHCALRLAHATLCRRPVCLSSLGRSVLTHARACYRARCGLPCLSAAGGGDLRAGGLVARDSERCPHRGRGRGSGCGRGGGRTGRPGDSPYSTVCMRACVPAAARGE